MRYDLNNYDFGNKTTDVIIDKQGERFTYVLRWFQGHVYSVVVFLNLHGIYELYGSGGVTVSEFNSYDIAIKNAIPFLESEIEKSQPLQICA